MIVNISPKTAEWHIFRNQHLGASEIPAFFAGAEDLPIYTKSAYALWMVKAGYINDDFDEIERQDQRVYWGIVDEPTTATGIAKLRGWTIGPGPVVEDDVCPRLSASIDFLVHDFGADEAMWKACGGGSGPWPAEVKSVGDDIKRERWTDPDGRQRPPPYTTLQHQAQLACTGAPGGPIVARFGGNDCHAWGYKRLEKTIGRIRHEVTAFWESIAWGVRPEPDWTPSCYAAIKAAFPNRIREEMPMTPEIAAHLIPACHTLLLERANEKNAKRRADEARAVILDAVQEYDFATAGDDTSSYRIKISANGALKVEELIGRIP